KLVFRHFGPARYVPAPGFPVKRLLGLACRTAAGALVRASATFRPGPTGLAAALLRFRLAQVFPILLRALVFRSTGFLKSNRDGLLRIPDLSVAPATELAMLELVHHALDGLLLLLRFPGHVQTSF